MEYIENRHEVKDKWLKSEKRPDVIQHGNGFAWFYSMIDHISKQKLERFIKTNISF